MDVIGNRKKQNSARKQQSFVSVLHETFVIFSTNSHSIGLKLSG
jgi:hypothetical protein